MQYDQYRAAGDSIATVVIEGACRHLMKDRMERSGMRWTLAGTRTMPGLRTVQVNGDYKNDQRFRIAAEQQRIHPLSSQFGFTTNPVRGRKSFLSLPFVTSCW